ncbi:CGNR zinc finger domain-containing protein [Ktedonospora formicarum]|uniref:Zinc finger CGNR domain-containing protein n=1 Tax=Ktedonospora formicarum TaxID=2778364 RepID=A0A8J3MNK4_9CHLR|nr:CGNR zinc finger domain-containing protein [Ktedonospora formicarum]GHO42852.1 hypothetical protein KSX_10150 [Ktedonospora formicarum]
METLVLDFLNSDWHDYRGSGRSEDYFLRVDWRKQFLANWHLDVDAEALDEATLRSLISLRTLLWDIALRMARGEQLADEDIVQLRPFLQSSAVQRDLIKDESGRWQLGLEPLKKDWLWVQSEIATSFIELVTRHDPLRIKTCANGDCGWIFYDSSKNRSRRWCAGYACGNVMTVRRYRARHAQKVGEA